jgi:hypothetical protein
MKKIKRNCKSLSKGELRLPRNFPKLFSKVFLKPADILFVTMKNFTTSSTTTTMNNTTTKMTTAQKLTALFSQARANIASGETKNVRRDNPAFATYFERLDFDRLPVSEQLARTVSTSPNSEESLDALIGAVANVAYMNDLTNAELANLFDELKERGSFVIFERNPVYSSMDLLFFASARLESFRVRR